MKPVKPRTSQSAQQPSCFGRDNEGAAKEGLSLHSQTVQAVSEEYCTRRRQFKKAKLRSGGFCEDARGRDTNAAKNLLARGWALMADLGFCQIAIAGEAKTVETAMNEGVGASTIAGAGHGPLEVGVPFHVASSNLEGGGVNDFARRLNGYLEKTYLC